MVLELDVMAEMPAESPQSATPDTAPRDPVDKAQRRDAIFLLKAFKARRLAIRKERLDPATAFFDDGLETYRTADEGRPGKTLSGFRDFALPLASVFQGQLMQDIWALYELDGKRGGYFVDFGATNGTTFNNSVVLERRFAWKGIVAEPNPSYHAQIFKNRKCAISTKCVHSVSGERLEFLCSTRGMMSHLAGKGEGVDIADAEIDQRVMVDTVTLDDLLDEHNAPPVIDFISIDTEGSEYDILSAFDFSRRHVRLFAVEHNFGTRRDTIHALMTANGYIRRFPELSRFDDWYIHRDDLHA
jgi:FkbM family methyltransferase